MSADSKLTLNADDIRLFRATVGTVRELTPHATAPARPKPKPRPLRWEDEQLAGSLAHDQAAAAPGALLSFLRPHHSPRLLQQLKKGRYPVQDELDLHHMGFAVAQASIERFLAEALTEELRCVRIIHGKGLRSQNSNAVLKGLTDQLLRRHQAVLAFASARTTQGGTGAVVVLLELRRPVRR